MKHDAFLLIGGSKRKLGNSALLCPFELALPAQSYIAKFNKFMSQRGSGKHKFNLTMHKLA